MNNILNLDNVDYSYHDRIPALSRVNLSVDHGSFYAVIGSNGSGKSTLLQLICGLIFPSAGSITYKGIGLTEKAFQDGEFLRFFRKNVGYVFQNSDIQLFCPTVLDELTFGPLQLGLGKDESMERALAVLAMLEIENLKDRPPYMLSGGEKKRVAIGSALTMNPELLLLDEPTSGLDPKTESFLMELILMLNEAGKTIIMATHNLELVDALQPQVAVLSEDHRIEKTGSSGEILSDTDLLIKVNLIHEHLHRHGSTTHKHLHAHYFFHKH